MIEKVVPSGRIVALLVLLAFCGTGLRAGDRSAEDATAAGSTLSVTHILGLPGVSNNAHGEISIERGAVRFKKSDGSSAEIVLGSIQDVFVGMLDKQVGGTPMALGKAATPFGGGRVIGLFAHKKYDTVTLQYVDANGGFHGAILQMNKGHGQILKNELQTERGASGPLPDRTTNGKIEETHP